MVAKQKREQKSQAEFNALTLPVEVIEDLRDFRERLQDGESAKWTWGATISLICNEAREKRGWNRIPAKRI